MSEQHANATPPNTNLYDVLVCQTMHYNYVFYRTGDKLSVNQDRRAAISCILCQVSVIVKLWMLVSSSRHQLVIVYQWIIMLLIWLIFQIT